MGWLSLIVTLPTLLKYGPQVYGIVREILDLISLLQGPEGKAMKAELKKAYASFTTTFDRSALLRLRDKLRHLCFGPTCHMG